MITLIVDADPIIYAAGFATEKSHYDVMTKNGQLIHTFEGKAAVNAWLKEHDKKEKDFVIDKRTEMEPLSHATHIIDKQLADLRKKFQAHEVLLFLTDDRKGFNFRDYVAMQTKYKDRPSNKRPGYYNQLRQHMIKFHNAKVVTGYEADDACSIQLTAAQAEGDEAVLVSIDKDLLQVPGRHYNPNKNLLLTVSQKAGIRSFYKQLLMGDTTDTIPGLPRIGEKTAEKHLADCETEEEYFKVALKLYNKAFGEGAGLYVMTETARLVYMIRFNGDSWLPMGKYFKEF